ncbi:hypothetical protein [Mobiluncus curtisii]|uniref:Uncharacterized protein n=1 Tax=Mobiluncus curtisii (strain ATCC 43063 / DSM 2711 / V125) TaxID=548479 RepID=D6ZIL8_MOBCV|nr:hypothetical protein [Mobiluncus curtisii]ADI66567.1 hypothetical protein HMPREF0573_10248 [Mobiluncus curtisii ATCC 43063]
MHRNQTLNLTEMTKFRTPSAGITCATHGQVTDDLESTKYISSSL